MILSDGPDATVLSLVPGHICPAAAIARGIERTAALKFYHSH